MSIAFKKLRRVDIDNLFKLWFNRSLPDSLVLADGLLSQAEFGKLCFEYKTNPDGLLAALAAL